MADPVVETNVFIEDVDKIHRFVNGGTTEVVGVQGGTIPTLRSIINNFQQYIMEIAGFKFEAATYAVLRNYRGVLDTIQVTHVLYGGQFVWDVADTTSADNGGTIIVDVLGRRWKRVYNSGLFVDWFGAPSDGTNASTAINATIAASGGFTDVILTAGKIYTLFQPLQSNNKLLLRSTSIGGMQGTAILRGAGLANDEFCVYLKTSYCEIEGIAFDCDSRRVSAINAGQLAGTIVAHSSIIRNCYFLNAKFTIDASLSCGVLVENCYSSGGNIGIRLDNTANTWTIRHCKFLNFIAANSFACIHVKWADQITIENCWTELNSVPAVYAERFSNLTIKDTWMEHLIVGNAQPVIQVNSPTTIKSENLVVDRCGILTNNNPIAIIVNANNCYFRNNRINGLTVPGAIYPVITATGTNYVRLDASLQGYNNQPPTSTDAIIVNGAKVVDRPSFGANSQLVAKANYSNRVFDSSFKGITNLAFVGDVVYTADNTIGVFDNNSLKLAFGPAGTGRVRTANNIVVAAGDYIRMSVWAWTVATTRHETLKLRFAGPSGGVVETVSLSDTPALYELIWQVDAPGAGASFAWFEAGQTGAYNAWVDDVQVIVSSTPIPATPYTMNNSLAAAAPIGIGMNLTEHSLLGRRITSGTATPTWPAVKNDIHYNDNAIASGFLGWVCVTSGSPGTWKTFGPISA